MTVDCCTNCGIRHPEKPGRRVWWCLRNYHGISGYFCPQCYDMVRHIDGRPIDPEAYNRIAVAFQLKRNTEG